MENKNIKEDNIKTTPVEVAPQLEVEEAARVPERELIGFLAKEAIQLAIMRHTLAEFGASEAEMDVDGIVTDVTGHQYTRHTSIPGVLINACGNTFTVGQQYLSSLLLSSGSAWGFSV